MSKRSWLPTQKGTELFPNVTVKPTKLIIRGVPSSVPLYDVVAQEFGGRLKQFHGKQQQAYSLSEAENSRGYIDWGDARATYTNIQGQETLTLEVDMSVLEALKKKQPELPWDWAVADFKVPVFFHTYSELGGGYTDSTHAMFYARLKVPEIIDHGAPKFTFGAEWGAAGDHLDVECSAETPPLLQFGYSPGAAQVGTTVIESQTIQVASLLIDMRPFHTFEELVVEIYGNLADMSDDAEPGGIVGKEFGAMAKLGNEKIVAGNNLLVRSGSSYTPDDILAMYPSLSSIVGASLTGWPSGQFFFSEAQMANATLVKGNYMVSLGEEGFGGAWVGGTSTQAATELFDPAILGVTTPLYGDSSFGAGLYWWQYTSWSKTGSGVVHDGPLPATPAGAEGDGTYGLSFLRQVFIFVPIYDTLPVVVRPASTVEVWGATFRGTPDWAWSDHDIEGDAISLSYAQWEIRSQYPHRFGLGRLAHDIPIDNEEPGGPTDPGHGMTLLGTLHVYPKRGGANFTPAQV